jgi:hypothetical protein
VQCGGNREAADASYFEKDQRTKYISLNNIIIVILKIVAEKGRLKNV